MAKTDVPRDETGKKIKTADEFELKQPDKFIWSGDDADGLVWLDEHEYTGTVPPPTAGTSEQS